MEGRYKSECGEGEWVSGEMVSEGRVSDKGGERGWASEIGSVVDRRYVREWSKKNKKLPRHYVHRLSQWLQCKINDIHTNMEKTLHHTHTGKGQRLLPVLTDWVNEYNIDKALFTHR